jgi:hypothetical protein
MLKLTTIIKNPPEKIFEYVTLFGKHGPIDKINFKKKYGVIENQEDNVYWTVDERDNVEWKCSFSYPKFRIMESVNSRWSDRTDKFEATETGTKWIIEWNIKSHGLKALIQLIYFKIKGYKTYHRKIIRPVEDHFSNHK